MPNFLIKQPLITICPPLNSNRLIAEVTRYHEKERDTKTTDRLYRNPHDTRKLAMHKYNKDTSYTFYEVQTIIILLHYAYTPNNSI